ncbi:MAG: flagellar hook-length control protein FliK [Bacillota bacterium]|nr:flagellar hook-length control protein FliK [Bacillota bacterium]
MRGIRIGIGYLYPIQSGSGEQSDPKAAGGGFQDLLTQILATASEAVNNLPNAMKPEVTVMDFLAKITDQESEPAGQDEPKADDTLLQQLVMLLALNVDYSGTAQTGPSIGEDAQETASVLETFTKAAQEQHESTTRPQLINLFEGFKAWQAQQAASADRQEGTGQSGMEQGSNPAGPGLPVQAGALDDGSSSYPTGDLALMPERNELDPLFGIRTNSPEYQEPDRPDPEVSSFDRPALEIEQPTAHIAAQVAEVRYGQEQQLLEDIPLSRENSSIFIGSFEPVIEQAGQLQEDIADNELDPGIPDLETDQLPTGGLTFAGRESPRIEPEHMVQEREIGFQLVQTTGKSEAERQGDNKAGLDLADWQSQLEDLSPEAEKLPAGDSGIEFAQMETQETNHSHDPNQRQSNFQQRRVDEGTGLNQSPGILTSQEINEPRQAGTVESNSNIGLLRETVLTQIVEHVRIQIDAHQQQVQIRLKPEHLGDVRIMLTIKDGLVNAEFTTENPLTGEIIQAAIPELRLSMQHLGVNLGEVNVGCSFQDKQSSFNGERRHHSQRSRFEPKVTAGFQLGADYDSFLRVDLRA